METVYTKRFIKTESDLPKREVFSNNIIIIFHEKYTDKTRHEEGYSSTWDEFFIREVDWYLEPRELPTDEMIEKEFPTDIEVIKKNEYSIDIHTTRTSNLLKQAGAKWLRDKIK